MSGSRGEVDELRRKLGRERALRREFEEAAIAAARELEDARDELEYTKDNYEEDMGAFGEAYAHAVASLTGLVSEIGAALCSMADGGEVEPDRLRAFALALGGMTEGALIALGSKALAAAPGEEPPARCMDCRGYGCARFASSACLYRPGDTAEPYAFNAACGRFEPWAADPAAIGLGGAQPHAE